MMKKLDAIQGLEDLLVLINTRLYDFKDDERLTEYINEILFGKVIEVNGRKDIIGGLYILEKEVRDYRQLLQLEAIPTDVTDFREVCNESGDTDTHQTH